MRCHSADFRTDSTEGKSNVCAEHNNGLKALCQCFTKHLPNNLAGNSNLPEFLRNRTQRRHHLIRQRQPDHLTGHRDFRHLVVELVRLRRKHRHRGGVAFGLLRGFIQTLAAHVEHRDQVHARLAEQLGRQHGLFHAVGHAREQVGELAHGAVGVLGGDPCLLQRIAMLEHAAGQALDASGDGLHARAALLRGQLILRQILHGDADALREVVHRIGGIDAVLDHRRNTGAAEDSAEPRHAGDGGGDGAGAAADAVKPGTHRLESLARLVFGGDDDAGAVISHGRLPFFRPRSSAPRLP